MLTGQSISHYKIFEKLGSGGMSEVWKAEDKQLRRTVALKFLSQETLGDEQVQARLIREAQAAASLDHPNICAVHGIHEEDGKIFIAMAYIGGDRRGPLRERLPVICGRESAGAEWSHGPLRPLPVVSQRGRPRAYRWSKAPSVQMS